ncbi:DUF4168 domain-containing protein [Sphingomonas baiyangensis]|nr:DUF4168 domain-containing protein [Sphingomonas baiyangensis]
MISIGRTLILTTALGLAVPALAQTTPGTMPSGATPGTSGTPPQTAPMTPPAATPPAGTTATATATTVSDADVGKFAKAMVAIDAVQKDAAITPEQKQTQMAAKVQEAGLDPARFNEIGRATQSDPALQAKVQTAITAEMGGATPTQ